MKTREAVKTATQDRSHHAAPTLPRHPYSWPMRSSFAVYSRSYDQLFGDGRRLWKNTDEAVSK
ncbi:hypothetical protein N7533_009678 [Penicillium manginii]|uniref:uncharacterized protein n=1 Tax=Penicillium manginii TaxID=203109 RepID=UPI002549172D|nr:uncharacterized protein N7533_009678 [Penicillium manginii]KAJ5744808.1 hypothetical protein N7533_009678 [Penicillium manginii]